MKSTCFRGNPTLAGLSRAVKMRSLSRFGDNKKRLP